MSTDVVMPDEDGGPATPVEAQPVALLDIIAYAREVLRLAEVGCLKPPEGKLYVVLVEPVDKARCFVFDDLDGLLAQLRPRYGQAVQAFAFLGMRLKVSKGGHYIFTPWGPRPLFESPGESGDDDDDGFLGDQPQLIQPAPQAAELLDDEDEDFDDEDTP